MGRILDALIGWSIANRVIVMAAAVALLVAGISASQRASIDVMPDFMPARVVVQTEARGLTAPDVEELVTGPVERVLLGTPEVASVRSTSSPGLSVVTLLFREGTEIFRARQLVAERLQQVRGWLPAVAGEPQLAPISAPVGALLKICLTSSDPDPKRAARALRTFADWTLRPRLLAIPGVAQVFAIGGEVERIEVRPDPVRMRERDVSIEALRSAIARSQAVAAGGFADSGEARVDVQSELRLAVDSAPEELAQVVLTRRGKLPVRVGDVATVVRGAAPRLGAASYDGRPAVYVQIVKLPWADTLRMTGEVERAIAGLAPALPAGARFEEPVFRQASFIETSLRSVGRAMALGSLLVILVLVAFLRSWRLATITLTAIPLSIVAAAAVLVSAGASINAMTLGGLAIAVGEVVDDAIVGVENAWRRLRENAVRPGPRPALEVIGAAILEVRGSVTYATVIVGAVLVPVLLLGGIAGRIFSPLAQAYILAIAASLLVAITVTPAMCAWLLPPVATAEARHTRLAERMLATYRRLLRWAVDRPRLVVGSAAGAALVAIVALPFLGGRFLPEFRERSLVAHLVAIPGTTLDETMRLAGRVAAQVRPEAAAHVAARAGRSELDEDAAPVHRVEADLVLPPGAEGELERAVATVSDRIARVPGFAVAVEGFLGERIHEILSGETAPVVVKVMGPELETLRQVASSVAETMERVPGLRDVRVEPQVDVAQLKVEPDRVALAAAGVLPADLAEELAAWRQGVPATEVVAPGGRIVEVAITGPEALRSREALASIPITVAGGSLPLSALAVIRETGAPAVVNHDEGERRIAIGASSAGARLTGAVRDLERRLKELSLPPGYRVELAGEAVARSEAAGRLLLVGALVLAAILALLSVAFRSLPDAGIVLLNIPLGLVGGVLGALLSPEGLSVAGFVGFVTLFGIIARNGIMLVAHKQHLDATEPDVPPVARILRAAEERLLPIIMTAATAGLGLLPLALSASLPGSELESPMAIVVVGGLVTSTALNLVVLPTIYVWLARRRAPEAS